MKNFQVNKNKRQLRVTNIITKQSNKIHKNSRFNHIMYEVAPVAGNKIEAACALQSLSTIMGQITSSHHGGSSSSNASKQSKLSHRHSTVVPKTNTDEPIYHRDLYKLRDSHRRPKNSGTSTQGSTQNARPITISEMNAYNAEKSQNSNSNSNNSNENGAKDSLLNNTTSNNNNSINGSNGSSGAGSIKSTSSASTKKKEFITDGEAYHKTDSCFYKRPDGGFHKLPPDSYHKMSEICYNKMPDGSFKRIDEILAMKNSNSMSDHTSQSHHSSQKVRNPMMRFLKRSKSHTPATIKEMQKAKEKEREQRLAAATAVTGGGANATQHSGSTNRKVVVTMMENGGLPIVATSKTTKREHSIRDSNKNKNKVKK